MSNQIPKSKIGLRFRERCLQFVDAFMQDAADFEDLASGLESGQISPEDAAHRLRTFTKAAFRRAAVMKSFVDCTEAAGIDNMRIVTPHRKSI